MDGFVRIYKTYKIRICRKVPFVQPRHIFTFEFIIKYSLFIIKNVIRAREDFNVIINIKT